MSHIITMHIIPYDDEYTFVLLEDLDDLEPHPVSDYYLKVSDLSINLFISLRWILWGYKFFSSLSEELDALGDEYSTEDLFQKTVQKIEDLRVKEAPKILTIDDNEIRSKSELDALIRDLYSNDIFQPSTKIHLKLRLNFREFLIISNCLYPTFMKWD